MTPTSLLRWVPDASQALRDMLDGSRGAVEPPNRSEIFGPERFAQHGLRLAETHRAQTASGRSAAFVPAPAGQHPRNAPVRAIHRRAG